MTSGEKLACKTHHKLLKLIKLIKETHYKLLKLFLE